MTKYRVYADGGVVHEQDFSEWDHSIPYYDDYATYEVPEEIEDHLISFENSGYWVGSNQQGPEKIYFNKEDAMNSSHKSLHFFDKNGNFVRGFQREGCPYVPNSF